MKTGEKVLYGVVVMGVCAGGYFVAKKARDMILSMNNKKWRKEEIKEECETNIKSEEDKYFNARELLNNEVNERIMSISVEDLYGDDEEEVEIKISMFDKVNNEPFNLVANVTKGTIRRIHEGLTIEIPTIELRDEREEVITEIKLKDAEGEEVKETLSTTIGERLVSKHTEETIAKMVVKKAPKPRTTNNKEEKKNNDDNKI